MLLKLTTKKKSKPKHKMLIKLSSLFLHIMNQLKSSLSKKSPSVLYSLIDVRNVSEIEETISEIHRNRLQISGPYTGGTRALQHPQLLSYLGSGHSLHHRKPTSSYSHRFISARVSLMQNSGSWKIMKVAAS